MKNPEKRGQGDAPLGLPPPPEESGGHPPSSRERISEQQKEDFTQANKIIPSELPHNLYGTELAAHRALGIAIG
jgi:hypothetical protein